MMTIVRTDGAAQATEDGLAARLDDLACEGARRIILAALEVEVEEYVTRHREARNACGHAVVARNGAARPRRLTAGSGTVTL